MTAGAEPVLAVENLVAGYEPDVPIVRGASLKVAAGEILAVLGPNGAGKSTAVKAVAGLVPVTAGAVRLDGAEVTRVAAHRRLGLGMAFVPQTDNVFASMSVADNLRLAGDQLPDRREADRQVEAMYDTFPDLARQRRLLAGRLSGGQRQMLAIARALMVRPRLLLLDEPSAGLSPKLVGEVFERLQGIRAQGLAILLVEQNVRAALRIADRAVVLVAGQNRHEGDAATLAANPDLASFTFGAAPTGAAA